MDLVRDQIEDDWLKEDIESQAISYAIQELVPGHFEEVSNQRVEGIERTEAAVKSRLTTEINFWDRRAEDLKAQEQAGRKNARLNSQLARKRADDLQARLNKRMIELSEERRISPLPPFIVGGAIVLPAGLIAKLQGEPVEPVDKLFGVNRKQVELAAAEDAKKDADKDGASDVPPANIPNVLWFLRLKLIVLFLLS
jgi:hypothetical protein